MPRVIVDTTNVPDSDRQNYEGPTPPVGLYKALWKRGWWTTTNDKSKTMLKLLFILDTENANKKQYNGYAVWFNVTYEPSTQWKMKELFTALRSGAKSAIEYDDKGNVTRIGKVSVGKAHVLIHGQEGTYKGVARMEVGNLAPLPLPAGMDEDDMGEFAEEGDATPYEQAGGIAQSSMESGDVSMDGSSDWSGEATTQYDEPPF